MVWLRKTKVVIYATCRGRLLVFTQPDFPEAGVQVPGGTVEDGEPIEEAAVREFQEETGLTLASPLVALERSTYTFNNGEALSVHERHFFHASLAGPLPETWTTLEETPDSGAPPVRFLFSWRPLDETDQRLAGGLGELLDRIGASRGCNAMAHGSLL